MAEVLRQARWIRYTILAITIFLAALVGALSLHLHFGWGDTPAPEEVLLLGSFALIISLFAMAWLDTHLYAVTLDVQGLTYGGILPRPRFIAREEIASWRRAERALYGVAIPFIDLYDHGGHHQARLSASLDGVEKLYNWLSVRAADDTGRRPDENTGRVSNTMEDALAHKWVLAFTGVALIANAALLLPAFLAPSEIGRQVEAAGLVVAIATVLACLGIARRYPDIVRIGMARDSNLPTVAAPILLTAALVSMRALVGNTVIDGHATVVGIASIGAIGLCAFAQPMLARLRTRAEQALYRTFFAFIAFGWCWTANQALDLSFPARFHTNVVAKRVERTAGAATYHVYVADWRDPTHAQPIAIVVTPSEYRRVARHGSVEVRVMPGALEGPWVASVRIEALGEVTDARTKGKGRR
jgi:hypothetical protein